MEARRTCPVLGEHGTAFGNADDKLFALRNRPFPGRPGGTGIRDWTDPVAEAWARVGRVAVPVVIGRAPASDATTSAFEAPLDAEEAEEAEDMAPEGADAQD
ncbi:hypothetical protein [Paroceanicella profunda]|uniref:hypothetical protein n=1 Tax=Paroceanicella profunda TaxID=2579971 RepID=UPI001478871C|nr:hypothetical protein [Paroceanicella profunda]